MSYLPLPDSDDTTPVYRPFRAKVARDPGKGWVYAVKGLWPNETEAVTLPDEAVIAFCSRQNNALLLRTDAEIEHLKQVAESVKLDDLVIEDAGMNIITFLPFHEKYEPFESRIPLFFYYVYDNDDVGILHVHNDLANDPSFVLVKTPRRIWVLTSQPRIATRIGEFEFSAFRKVAEDDGLPFLALNLS